MDLTLSPEQDLLAEAAGAFVARSCPPARARAAIAAGGDVALWAEMAALGWAGLLVEPVHGGAGAGLVDLVVLCEQLGRAPVPSPLLASATLGALAVARAGSKGQRARWLPDLASGTRVATLALVEPGMHDEWAAVAMTQEPGTEVVLSGTKLLVPWGEQADLLVVATQDGLVVVEPSSGGVRRGRHNVLGVEPLCALGFDGAAGARLGDAPSTRPMLQDVLDHYAIAQLGLAVGAAQRALELSVQHARDREQFGQPIGAFQAVAHRCAEMRADVDACRWLARQAAWALDRRKGAEVEVAAAKSYANEALRRVFRHAHQVHGAIGFSTEHDLHLYTRAGKSFELAAGSTSRHRARLAAAMGLR